MKIFKNRQSAGKLLAKRLRHFFNDRGTIVLGIPRGGVVVASAVAESLGLPLDIIVTRKIGAPMQPELALGAVDPDGEVVGEFGSASRRIGDLGEIIEKEVEEIKRREEVYRQGRDHLNMENKVVILVDDGIATGATTLAAINYLKRHKARKVILATPVAAKESVDRVRREIGKMGEIIVLEKPEYFEAVGQFYQEFLPVSDQEVIKYLNHE